MPSISDAEMIGDPNNWPFYPLLPVKRSSRVPGEGPECCTIFAGESKPKGPIKLVKKGMYTLPKDPEEFLKLDRYEYPNIEAMIADGWEVD